jgi:hypothetical protein
MLADVILGLLGLLVIGLSVKIRWDFARHVDEAYGRFVDEVDREERQHQS